MPKLSSYPNMRQEIIEAIDMAYKNYPDVIIDCLLYLTDLKDNSYRVIDLSNKSMQRLQNMGRCPYCGELLEVYHYQEPHPEIDGCPMEDFYEPYCPHCNLGE